jgi:hypothetical protein
MAIGSELWSRARRVALLALLAVSATGALLGGQQAFARWQPAATRSESSGRVRITSNRVTRLYPGVSRELILTLHNTNSRRSVSVRRIRVHDRGTTKRRCAPIARNLTIHQYTGSVIRLPPGGARSVSVLVTMPRTVANACQRAVFRLHYSAQTSVAAAAR